MTGSPVILFFKGGWMINNQWYVILESSELRKKPLGVTRLGAKLVLWRDTRGIAHAAMDICPHRGAAFSVGEVINDHIQCPFHGFEFDGTGACKVIPANGWTATPPKAMKVKTFPVREEYGYIWLWWGDLKDEYPSLPWFEDLDNSFSYAGYQAHWPVHYSRAIENQLDVIHLPFVHATTIGRGNKTIVDGPLVRENNNEMDIWVYNRRENGKSARKTTELPAPSRPPFLRFIFPNNWMNRISDDYRITVSFVPVDDHNTLFYLRNYMRKLAVPGLAWFAAWASIPSARVILNQDRRIVLTQIPDRSDLFMDEKPIPQDGPIIQYRRIRNQLQKSENN